MIFRHTTRSASATSKRPFFFQVTPFVGFHLAFSSSGELDIEMVILIQNVRFMKLGLQGHSVFYASGDDGVAGPPGDDSANGCLGPQSTIFSPAWPNRSVYLASAPPPLVVTL